MSTEYRNNHYVPVWYQRRFIPPNINEQALFYLNLKPKVFYDTKGKSHCPKPIKKQGFKPCFAEYDLYTTQYQFNSPTDIEKIFFGTIDSRGNKAVKYFSEFAHPSANGNAFNDLLLYLSTQKLRTPKGLGYISQITRSASKDLNLQYMLRLRKLYCAIWAECIWLIADASRSETKFIISDHPVTVYNRRCGPRSNWCRDYNDPDIRFNGTHTIFPLSYNKILIMTNLSWVRNPYQSPIELRPNPNPFRSALFNYRDIQILRHLSEQEVREINFIIKSRALKYLAAGKEEWLYPDEYITKANWNTFGHGYLLMPDPRPVHLGGGVSWGNDKGALGAMDEYGRQPGQKNYSLEDRSLSEAKSLYKFKGEFAKLFGPKRRGRSFNLINIDDEVDSEKMHQHHLGYFNKGKHNHKNK